MRRWLFRYPKSAAAALIAVMAVSLLVFARQPDPPRTRCFLYGLGLAPPVSVMRIKPDETIVLATVTERREVPYQFPGGLTGSLQFSGTERQLKSFYRQFEYRFAIDEVLAGSAPRELIRVARFPHDEDPDEVPNTDFDAHTDPSFWGSGMPPDRDRGRVGYDLLAGCGTTPAFVPGDTYLLFLDRSDRSVYGADHRAYERIRSPDDRWLAFVRESLAAHDSEQP